MTASISIIGFVGGIASGKSALAGWLGERLAVCVVDADKAGHRALLRDDVREQLRQQFGHKIFDENNEVSRSRLAATVFGDTADHAERRRQLESIVHPAIREDCHQQIQHAQQSGAYDLIVYDAAVMLESGWADFCDRVYFLDVPRSVRLQRVIEHRGWDAAELTRREASQWPLDRKRQAADAVIDNSQDIDIAGEQLLKDLVTHQLLPQQQPIH